MPGKRTLVQAAMSAPGQLDGPAIQQAAAEGVTGGGSPLPHSADIQHLFGRHDVSGIQAHVGGRAETASRAIGAEAYATGDHVAFASAPGLHLAAHEAAHVVQQRGSVQLKGGVGEVGDGYEQHADAVADAVVRGESAERLLDQHAGRGDAPVQRHVVQRFGSLEHKTAADAGSGNQTYRTSGLTLAHGDYTMLRGDYFEEDQLYVFARITSWARGQLPNTQDEVLYAIHDATDGKDPRFAKGGEWAGIEFSDPVKKAVKDRFYALANKNYNHFLHPGLAGFGRPGGADPGGSQATYRDAHEKAVDLAYQAGREGSSMDDAMIREAMGEHFLTDSFAAGHATTPRGRLENTWDRRYSNFTDQFVEKIVRDMSQKLADQASLIANVTSTSDFIPGVRSQINEKLAGKPKPTIGKLLGSVAHDYDNREGLWFTNDLGWKWYGRGDGHLDDAVPKGTERKATKTQRQVVTEAVTAGCDDVRTAYALGVADKAAADPTPLHDRIRARTKSPATPDSVKYAPEQFLPRLAPDEHQEEQNSNADSIETLWTTHIRSGQDTWGTIIINDMGPKGTTGSELVAMRDGLPEKQNPFLELSGPAWLLNLTPVMMAFHGNVFPRRAFTEAVVNRLQNDTLNFLLEALANK